MTMDAGRARRIRIALALAVAGWACAAFAQQGGDGMIVIPGRGESAQAALAHAAAQSADAPPHAAAQPANANQAAGPASQAGAGVGQRAAQDAQRVVQVVAQDAPPQAQAAQPAPPARVGPNAQPQAVQRGFAEIRASFGSGSGSASFQQASMRAPATAFPLEDSESIRRAALAFLQQQAAGLPGRTTVTVAPAFARGLAACATLEPFLPTGARLWGRTTVGVRCAGARPWTLYLQAKLAVEATYYVASRPIMPGTALTAADLIARDGDLTLLPLAVITDPSQAIGAITLSSVAAGLPLRQDMLKSAASVTAGQRVRVVAAGQGFTISAEGSVLSNAAPGQQVQVRMAAGQIVTAIVKDAGTVEMLL